METLTSARMGHPGAVASSTRALVTSRGPSCSLSPAPRTELDTFIHSFTHLFKNLLTTCFVRARECTRHWVLLRMGRLGPCPHGLMGKHNQHRTVKQRD